MTEPVRLQLSRRRGFDLQQWSRAVNGLDAVKADRSTRLGNPFRVTSATATSCGGTKIVWVVGGWSAPAMWIKDDKTEALAISIRAYRAWITRPENAGLLARARGKNLACWCAEGAPCHADVLLELANKK